MKLELPQNVKKILWDVDLAQFDPHRYPEFLAVRIAEKGNLQSLRWYINVFGLTTLINFVTHSPETRPATKEFWNRYAAL